MTAVQTSWLRENALLIIITVAGWIVAGMASYAAMSARVTVVEVTSKSHETRIEKVEATTAGLDRVVAKLDALVDRLDRQQQGK